jgi:hypothetical protein
MKLYAVAVICVSLTGCGSMNLDIPSFWDDNQSARIIDVRKSIADLDCAQPHAPQVQIIKNHLHWFELYSESRRSQDVARLIQPMQQTVEDFYQRSISTPGSRAYCENKKSLMVTQGKTVARAVLGRF